tara:strand:+ start:614 stop:1399 length:786 start_codon:yes stop_codon:yes gene_type:complete
MSLIPAATVLLFRQNNDAMEVLLVERSSKTAFGDLYVFPGGKVDFDDNFSDKLSSHSDLNDADCSKLLDIECGGASFWVACIRECFEEVGVLLARKKDGSKLDLNKKDKGRFVDYRERLISNKISFLEVCEREDLFFETTNIVPFSHWITPDIETKRFDTRFFAAEMPKDQTTLHDGNELTNSLWITPKEAIKKAWNGEIKMILPTSKNLEQTFDFNSINELISFYKNKGSSEIKSILPKFKKVDGKWEGRLPDDEGYEDF